MHPEQPLRPDDTWTADGQHVGGPRTGGRSGMQVMLHSISFFALRVAVWATIISTATFVTGFAVFDGSGRPDWIVIGGAICIAPPGAALLAAWRVRRAAVVGQALGAPINPEVRALVTLPKLTVIAMLGMLCVGALGTVLFIGAVID